MPRLLRSARNMTAGLQARLHHARQRRRAAADPSRALFRTHRLTAADSPIAMGTSFPSRTAPVTLAFNVKRASGTASGEVVEFGDTAQLVVSVSGDTLNVSVGDGSLTLSAAIPGIDKVHRFVLSVRPGDGRGTLWRDGELADDQLANFGTVWADDGTGNVAPNLSDASLVGVVSAYRGQVPQQMQGA